MNYPLFVSFKIMAFAPQFSVTDANGEMLCYVRQKLFKLKEEIKVFREAERINQLYSIRADRIIDFSARYHYFDMSGRELGSIKRKGMRSLWRAHYLLTGENNQELTLTEDSVMVRFLDNIFTSIPIINCCSGLVFHPSYTVKRADGTEIMRVKKMPAFFEGKFKIEKIGAMSENEERQVFLGILMMLLLERLRG